jgi:hypothetical protein
MKSACFLGFRLIFLLPPIQPHLAGGRRHPSSHPSPAAQHQAEPTHGAPRPAVDFHEPPPSAAPRPAVGRREPSPSAAVSPHRQPPRATAICRREPPPSAAPGARLAPLLRSSTSRCPRPLRSPGAPPVRCSPGALPCCPDGHGCARGFNVPAGGGRGHNFLPVTGRGRGHGHRVCLAGAGL